MNTRACFVLEVVREARRAVRVPVPLPKASVGLTSRVSSCCRRMPSLLEYLSYNCNFMGILAGPLCSYKDYITFIEGRSYQMAQSGENGKEEVQCERTEPSPNVRPETSLPL